MTDSISETKINKFTFTTCIGNNYIGVKKVRTNLN